MATINAIGSNKPIEVAFGGTGAATLTGVLTGNGTSAVTASTVTQHGVVLGGASNAVSSLGVASTGQTLMGNTGADPSFTGSPSFSGSVTAGTSITATNGAITASSGNVVITSGNLTIPTTSSTVGQIVQNGNRILHTFGTGNLFIGTSAGNFTTTGTFNCGVGPTSSSPVMASLTSGSQNTCLGLQTLNACTSGGNNVAVGFNTSLRITQGNDNVAVGQAAMASVTTGSFNVGLGSSAGGGFSGGDSSNICIGYNVGGTAGQSNTLTIGAGTGTGNGQVNVAAICGISGKTSASGVAVLVNTSNVLGTTTSSVRFKENIQDMGAQSSDIYKLRPVTFTYKVSKPHVDEESSKLRQFGLIAEEVEQVMPDQVTYNLDGNIESVRYLNFIPMLINEIQKLRKEVEELKIVTKQ